MTNCEILLAHVPPFPALYRHFPPGGRPGEALRQQLPTGEAIRLSPPFLRRRVAGGGGLSDLKKRLVRLRTHTYACERLIMGRGLRGSTKLARTKRQRNIKFQDPKRIGQPPFIGLSSSFLRRGCRGRCLSNPGRRLVRLRTHSYAYERLFTGRARRSGETSTSNVERPTSNNQRNPGENPRNFFRITRSENWGPTPSPSPKKGGGRDFGRQVPTVETVGYCRSSQGTQKRRIGTGPNVHETRVNQTVSGLNNAA